MHDLSTALSACNPMTKLHVVRGAPRVVLPYLFKEWGISHLVYEKDTAGYAAIRDRQITELASQAGVKVLSVLGHTLYDPELVVKENGGKATMSLASWHAVRIAYREFLQLKIKRACLSGGQRSSNSKPSSADSKCDTSTGRYGAPFDEITPGSVDQSL